MVRLQILWLGILVVLSTWCFAWVASGQITPRYEVNALRAVRAQLKDTRKELKNWRKGDPCTSNWTGVICNFTDTGDGYYHVQELRLMRKGLLGNLSPELGKLTRMTILNFMYNNISGSIPREIGNMTSLTLLLLGGNQISGSLPDELGNLPNVTKFQLNSNNITGPLPKSFANLATAVHFHMNNNSISGQIPSELYKLPSLIHFLLDNNNLSGYLPPELSMMPKLRILQLDNNNFEGTEIPQSYTNMTNLFKLSLRNCKLQGPVPDFSTLPKLLYLDLSRNQLNGTIPTNRLASGITAIDLSNNQLDGPIPSNFSGLPGLQNLSLQNNYLTGDVPTDVWQNRTFTSNDVLVIDLRNNALTGLSGTLNPPYNVTIMLDENPVCRKANDLNISAYCSNQTKTSQPPPSNSTSNNNCLNAQLCPASSGYELVPDAPDGCICSAPLGVGYLLRSPSIADFPPYLDSFRYYITSNLQIDLYQLQISTPFVWERGPRLRMFLKIHPKYTDSQFNTTAIQNIVNTFARYKIPGNDTFGPYDVLNFTYLGPYGYLNDEIPGSSSMSKGVVAAIVLGSVSVAGVVVLAMVFVFRKLRHKKEAEDQSKHSVPKVPMKVSGLKGFGFEELKGAASNFEITSQIGQGGYGKVYKGTLADGTVVAIKRAQQGSLQGQNEFFTEIELLSRLHHRNLVSLLGYCDEQNEQMLVYEFMPNGSLRDLLFRNDEVARFGSPLKFAERLRIALGAAKGILYLHTEADPPIIHRDIKATNILLDGKLIPKVSDFGISRLFPEADADTSASLSAHVYTYVKGTPGYVDPEYFQTHKLTEKSDVYSLGVVFLELLTRMQSISHGRHIVQEVLSACQAGVMFSIIDRRMGPYPSECVKKFMALALKCCEEEGKGRPTMLVVVRELENLTGMLPQSEAMAPESDTSSPAVSGSIPSMTNIRDLYVSGNLTGSNLVSGVIPTIRPR